MNPIGIAINTLPGMTEEEYICTAAELGFTATFDMGAKPRETLARLGDLCAANGIAFETLHAPWGHINDIWLPGDDGDQMLEELKDTIDKCGLVGAPIAVVHLSSKMNPPTITDVGRGRFEALVSYAQSKQMKIAFENQRKLFNLAWAMETFRSEDGVGFCWDCGHEGCFTPGLEFMPLFGNRLICTHIHDNSGIFDADQHLIPFDGSLDFSRIARQLREADWQGTLMLELKVYRDIPPKEYLFRAAAAAKRLAQMAEI